MILVMMMHFVSLRSFNPSHTVQCNMGKYGPEKAKNERKHEKKKKKHVWCKYLTHTHTCLSLSVSCCSKYRPQSSEPQTDGLSVSTTADGSQPNVRKLCDSPPPAPQAHSHNLAYYDNIICQVCPNSPHVYSPYALSPFHSSSTQFHFLSFLSCFCVISLLPSVSFSSSSHSLLYCLSASLSSGSINASVHRVSVSLCLCARASVCTEHTHLTEPCSVVPTPNLPLFPSKLHILLGFHLQLSMCTV